MYGGSYSHASKAARLIDGRVTEGCCGQMRGFDETRDVQATALMVLVRFGKWEELIDMPFAMIGVFPGTFTLLELRKGNRYGAKGKVDLATRHRQVNVFELVLEQKIG